MKNYNIKEKWVVVGEIIKTHGTRGLVKIISYCEKPHSIFDYQPIVLKSTGEKIDFELDEEKNNLKTHLIISEENVFHKLMKMVLHLK